MVSCDGDSVEVLVFDRGEHPERAVTSLSVVEDLEVLEDRVGELDASLPLATVEQLDLHAAPERLDDRVVEAVTDRSHRRDEPGFLCPTRERPRRELRAVIRVDDRAW